jgi:protein-tyrosine phosphatase
MSHHQELQNLLSDHSFSVLTVLQKFENQENGLVGTPIKPTDWINLSIPHKQIEIFDLNPISISELNEGVDFIHQQLEQRHVYVHCKVGRGRSAMMIMGYIMKYHQQELNLQENDNVVQKAIEFVRKSRPQIYVTAAQKSALQDYAVTLFA